MSGDYLNRLSQIPDCIPGPTGDYNFSFKKWLQGLNEKANQRSHHSDDSFSVSDFYYAQGESWGRELQRFSSYSAFQTRVDQYIEQNYDPARCSCDGLWVERPEKGSYCISNPPPPPPERPKPKKPQRPPPPKRPPPPPKPDISRFDLHKAPWWGAPPPENTVRPIPKAGEIVALEGRDFAPKGPGPFEAYKEMGEGPERFKTDHPVIRARFDGKFFILDIYGCHVNRRRPNKCLAPWPFFFLILRNITSHQNAKKRSGADGWARIKVAAKKGDNLIFSGIDSFSHVGSINELRYSITQDGKIRFGGSFLRNGPSKTERDVAKAADAIGTIVPQAGAVLHFFNDVGRLGRPPKF